MRLDDRKQLVPQLEMVRESLDGLPDIELPDGYSMRTYLPGDGTAWERIIGESFNRNMEPGSFDSMMRTDSAFLPERIFFAVYESAQIATASAWSMPGYGDECGYLHYVGCADAHRGKGVGKAVSYAALHRIKKEGRAKAVLRTDDSRIPAIRMYIKLNFRPLLVHENQRERWRKICKEIDKGLLNTFQDIFAGPVYPIPDSCSRRSN